MLCLSRKPNETIVTNGPCTETVIEIDRGKVRLAIDAEREVQILRGELGKIDRPASIGQSEAQKAGLGEQWQELRRLVDGGK